jgi:hypothetical protein
MNLLMSPLALLGMLAGLLLWSRIVKTVVGILAIRNDVVTMLNDFQKVKKLLIGLCVASSAWAIAFVALAVHFAEPSTSGVGWAWFFGGVATTPLLILPNVLKVTRKIKVRGSRGV